MALAKAVLETAPAPPTAQRGHRITREIREGKPPPPLPKPVNPKSMYAIVELIAASRHGSTKAEGRVGGNGRSSNRQAHGWSGGGSVWSG